MLPLEKTILRELFHRREFAELVIPYIQPTYFHSDAAGLLYKLYSAFFEKFKVVPQFTAIKIGLDSVPGLNEKESQGAQTALKEVEAEAPLSQDQETWFLEEVEDFCKKRALHLGLLECIKLMDDPAVSKHVIPDIMKTALAVSFDKSVGHDFLGDADARYEFYHTQEARIPFDVETLNSMTKGGLPRKTLSVVMAGCHAKGERILLSDGRIKCVEDVVVGDSLVGTDGLERVVKTLHSGRSPLYRINVSSTGDSYTVNDSHILTLVNTVTDEIVDVPLMDYLSKNDSYKHKHKTFYNNAILPFVEDAVLDIDPYVMGIWLGDGHTHTMSLTTMDCEVSEAWMSFGGTGNCRVSNNGSRANAYHLTPPMESAGWGKNFNPLAARFAKYGLHIGHRVTRTKCGDKHIPDEYKRASSSQRLELLAGLIDTDGWLNTGGRQSYGFCNKSLRLVNDVQFVARSLGFYSYKATKVVNGNDYYIVGICPTKTTPIIPVRIPRKQPSGEFHIRRNLTRSAFTVELIGEGEFYGFEVDGDGRYTLGNFVVTHNTNTGKSLMLVHMSAACLRQSKNVLYITLEMAEERVAERIDANMMDIPIDDVNMLSRSDYIRKIHHMRQTSTGRLIIKEYPTGSANVSHFRALLQELKLKQNFTPDIIMVDYLSICGSARVKMGSNINSYTLYKFVAEELRGLAVEYNVPVFTAAQFNRQGYGSSDPGIDNVGESWAIPQTADFMFALVSNAELEKLGQISLQPMKNRFAARNSYQHHTLGIDTARQKIYDLTGQALVNSLSSVNNPPSTPTKPAFSSFSGRRKRPLSKFANLGNDPE